MPTTAQERALHASRKASATARTRRFQKYVREMTDDPAALDKVTQVRLAEVLHECGWRVTEEH